MRMNGGSFASVGQELPRFVQQALAGKPITVYGDGNQTRCFGYVDDIVNTLVKLINSPKANGHIFNLGSDEEISIKELARKVNKMAGDKSKIVFMPYEKIYGQDFDDMAHRRPDLSKIRKFIGYRPKVSLEESLKKIIAYFRA